MSHSPEQCTLLLLCTARYESVIGYANFRARSPKTSIWPLTDFPPGFSFAWFKSLHLSEFHCKNCTSCLIKKSQGIDLFEIVEKRVIFLKSDEIGSGKIEKNYPRCARYPSVSCYFNYINKQFPAKQCIWTIVSCLYPSKVLFNSLQSVPRGGWSFSQRSINHVHVAKHFCD